MILANQVALREDEETEMSSDGIVLEDYEDRHAAAVARMWEESRGGWPPGFLSATEMTAESVEREERLSGKLFTVLALDGDRVVGYNRVTPYGGETDASYVALLNVVSDLHGKKIGKRLLLDGVGKVTKQGYYRLDLHTWPANMKAVPLYKKTGFFWVPDTMVYMQNYMPFILGRPEFTEFAGDDDWYSIQVRDLSVEPDLTKSDSGRRVFRYLFEKEDGSRLEAEFDSDGRVLSAWKDPERELAIERDSEKLFFGVPVGVDVSGPGAAGSSLSHWKIAPEIEPSEGPDDSGSLTVVPRPLAVPYSTRDRAPRLSIPIETGPDRRMELGLGFRAEDILTIESLPIRRPAFGQEKLGLLLRRNAGGDRGALSYSIDSGPSSRIEFDLAGTRFQQVEILLPELGDGAHSLHVEPSCDGTPGVPTDVSLVSGFTEGTAGCECRRSVVVNRGLLAIAAGRRGGSLNIYGHDGRTDKPQRLARLSLPAGPPFWNSDFPHQIYELELDEAKGEIRGETNWPSRPGWRHRISYRLREGGVVEAWTELVNGSDTPGRTQFSCTWWWRISNHLRELSAVPFWSGTVCSPHAYNMFPDGDLDFPDKVSELSAPWLAASGSGRAVVGYFPGWESLGYGNPISTEVLLEPGETRRSPVFFLLTSGGDVGTVLGMARAMGWDVGESTKLLSFPEVRGVPVATTGDSISVVNHAHGKRDIAVSSGDEEIGSGSSSDGTEVEASLEDAGLNLLDVAMAGVHHEVPIFVASGAGEPMLAEAGDGTLSVENGALSVKLRPSSRGHVFSVVAGGRDYIHACDPGPGEFAWEKPWFGGIRPWMQEEHERPLPLEEIECRHHRAFDGEFGGVLLKGWETSWRVDDEHFGSFELYWRIGLLPGVPLLHASVEVCPLAGGTLHRTFAIRANLAPGGTREGVVFTCCRRPGTSIGRDHGGGWMIAGNWARVSGPGGAFAEVHQLRGAQIWMEDYAKEGCHLGIWDDIEADHRVETVWIFGEGTSAGDLSTAFRSRR